MINLINDYSLSSLGTFENEILEELKSSKYNDLEDMVYRFQLTYAENIDISDEKYIQPSTIRNALPLGIYKVIDIKLMLKSLLPNQVQVNNTIDYARLKSNLTTKNT